MIRNRKRISYFLAALLLVQFTIGGFVTGPFQAAAASGGPLAVSTSPSTGAANVPLNAKLILTLDENVMKGSGPAAISIRRTTDHALFQSYIVASDSRVQIGSARNIVTITPDANFDVNTNYYVSIDVGAFVNESNNTNFGGISGMLAWNFTTVGAADTTPPTITSTAPVNGGTAGIGTSLTLTLNEPVYAVGGNIFINNVVQPGDVRTINVTSTNVSGSATSTITVQLPAILKGSSNYEIIIPAGAFQDGAGNSFVGVTTGQWRFATSVPPLGNPSLSPQANSFAIAVGTNLALTFPSAVALNTGNIRINKISDNSTVQTIPVISSRISISDKTVTIDPPDDLAANTGFYILIDARAFKDASDGSVLYQGIADARTWSFVTDPGNDATPPTLLADRKPLSVQATPTLNLEMNFSEPVYPGNGNIVIKTSPSGNVFASIPVTSNKLNGGGTTKITVVDPSITFVNNATYYAEIGGQAFSDAKGNYYAGITGSTEWPFIVTQVGVKPTIVAQTPANLTTGIGLTGIRLEALFSEQIQLGTNPAAVKVKRITGTNTTPFTTTLSIDPQNNRKLIIAIDGTLAGSTDYYVEMAEGAVSDMAGNRFEGILNQYQWTFSTINSSTGTPAVTKAELTGNIKITLTFNNALDTSSVPVPANFYVTVNGAGRAVTEVQVNNQFLTLTLQSSVVNGQIIKVSYSAGSKPIKGLNGIAAANFSNRDVTNNPDNVIPRQLNAALSGNMIILTFSEELAAIHSSAYSQFTVYVDGYSRSVTQISGSGTAAFLTFNGSAVITGQTVSLTYYATSYPLKDLVGNALPSFNSFYVQNGLDTKAPALQSVTAAVNQITLVYDEALNAAFLPSLSSFYVTVGDYRSKRRRQLKHPVTLRQVVQLISTCCQPTKF
ncbi:Ig-like domain-containing protein [Paenibacillus solisilvae]|uniref:Ig-like domain-containing protein n=1 Tax=Paenibacillus solisilvae TaxID=2486751 RepID=A0ABW0W5I3_9BACL